MPASLFCGVGTLPVERLMVLSLVNATTTQGTSSWHNPLLPSCHLPTELSDKMAYGCDFVEEIKNFGGIETIVQKWPVVRKGFRAVLLLFCNPVLLLMRLNQPAYIASGSSR